MRPLAAAALALCACMPPRDNPLDPEDFRLAMTGARQTGIARVELSWTPVEHEHFLGYRLHHRVSDPRGPGLETDWASLRDVTGDAATDARATVELQAGLEVALHHEFRVAMLGSADEETGRSGTLESAPSEPIGLDLQPTVPPTPSLALTAIGHLEVTWGAAQPWISQVEVSAVREETLRSESSTDLSGGRLALDVDETRAAWSVVVSVRDQAQRNVTRSFSFGPLHTDPPVLEVERRVWSPGTAEFAWTSVPGAAQYRLYAASGADTSPGAKYADFEGTDTSGSYTRLNGATTYRFRLVAVGSNGKESVPGDAVVSASPQWEQLFPPDPGRAHRPQGTLLGAWSEDAGILVFSNAQGRCRLSTLQLKPAGVWKSFYMGDTFGCSDAPAAGSGPNAAYPQLFQSFGWMGSAFGPPLVSIVSSGASPVSTPNPPPGMRGHSFARHAGSNTFYVLGGDLAAPGSAPDISGDFWKVVPNATPAWIPLAPSTPRVGHVSAVLGDKLYVFGGGPEGEGTDGDSALLAATLVPTPQALAPVALAQGSPAPSPRHSMGVSAAAGRLYVAGGTAKGGDGPYAPTNQIWEFRSSTATWKQREAAGAGPAPGRLALAPLVAEGATDSASDSDLVVVDGADAWLLPSGPSPRWIRLDSPPVVSVWTATQAASRRDGVLYELCGAATYDGSPCAAWRLVPRAWRWERLAPQGTAPPYRYGAVSASDEETGAVLLYGGHEDAGGSNVWDPRLFRLATTADGPAWSVVPTTGTAPTTKAPLLFVAGTGAARTLEVMGTEYGTDLAETWSVPIAGGEWLRRTHADPPPYVRMNGCSDTVPKACHDPIGHAVHLAGLVEDASVFRLEAWQRPDAGGPWTKTASFALDGCRRLVALACAPEDGGLYASLFPVNASRPEFWRLATGDGAAWSKLALPDQSTYQFQNLVFLPADQSLLVLHPNGGDVWRLALR